MNICFVNGIFFFVCRFIFSFLDIYDFLVKNNGINKKSLESLILAGCFDEFGINRKTLIYNLDELMNYKDLVTTLDKDYVLLPDIKIEEEYSIEEMIMMEKDLFGLYISNHPTTTYKAKYDKINSLEKIEDLFDKNVKVIVLVEKIKKITTKKGENMIFFDGSDEYSKESFTMFPSVYKEYSNIKVGDIVAVLGHVERRYNDYQIVVQKINKLN